MSLFQWSKKKSDGNSLVPLARSFCFFHLGLSFIHLSQGCSVWESRKQEKNSPSCSIVPSAPESCNSTTHNPSLRSHVSHFTSRIFTWHTSWWLHAPEATRCVLQSSSQLPTSSSARPQERHIAHEICLTSQLFLLDGNEIKWSAHGDLRLLQRFPEALVISHDSSRVSEEITNHPYICQDTKVCKTISH